MSGAKPPMAAPLGEPYLVAITGNEANGHQAAANKLITENALPHPSDGGAHSFREWTRRFAFTASAP